MKKIPVRILIVILAVAYAVSGCGVTQKEQTMQTVTSSDGTKIGYEKSGNGPAVILVGGALATHENHAELAQLLSADFTVYNYDRRGRGESGDTKPYAVTREIEDIRALIDETGGTVYLYGISSGACLALEATAALGDKVKKLAIYEAPYDESEGAPEEWKAYSATLDQLIAATRNADAVEFHLEFVGVPDAMLAAMKVTPAWAGMKALAPTIAYDVAVVGENRSIPVERIATLQANTLVMDGGASLESMPFMHPTAVKIANTIPAAQHKTLDGQSHTVDSKILASVLKEFFRTEN